VRFRAHRSEEADADLAPVNRDYEVPHCSDLLRRYASPSEFVVERLPEGLAELG
jgi:hypothetical protein